jgi:hypothetical protein
MFIGVGQVAGRVLAGFKGATFGAHWLARARGFERRCTNGCLGWVLRMLPNFSHRPGIPDEHQQQLFQLQTNCTSNQGAELLYSASA